MTITEDFIRKLQEATGQEPLPQKFWENFSHDSKPTFQDVLNKYSEYCSNLPSAQKEMSKIFWEHVRRFGTPIIEEQSNEQSAVYFLFPRERLSDCSESKGTKKELYLQGDFHGYGSTFKESQELSQLPGTDIMYRRDTMPKDALVTYYYVQLEPEHGNKKATHFYGDVAFQPPSFFPVKPSIQPADKPPTKTQEEIRAADDLFNGPDSVLIDEFSKYHKIYDPKSGFFCASPDKDISYLSLPVEDKEGPSLPQFFLDLEKTARLCLFSVDDKVVDNPADRSKISRSIQVFAPPGDAELDQIVIISDGRFYQLGNTIERLDKLMSQNTAVIFITPENAIAEEAIRKGVEFEASDALSGMGSRTVDLKYRIDEYADFIHNELLPELMNRGIKIPTDPNKRVLVGSSLGGTACIYMGMAHPEWFGKVVAQSPSIINRGKLEEKMSHGIKLPPPEIFLSCGIFECPQYAKNLNLPFAEELAEHLGIQLHLYHHGHQMEGWSPQLENSLPALGLNIKANQTPILTPVQDTEVGGLEVKHTDAMIARKTGENSSPLEVARGIKQRYKGDLEKRDETLDKSRTSFSPNPSGDESDS